MRKKLYSSCRKKDGEIIGVYKCIVYVLSENLKEVVARSNSEVNLAYKSNQTVVSLFTNLKTKIDKVRRSNIIYKIDCKEKSDESCNLYYIGTTKQQLR